MNNMNNMNNMKKESGVFSAITYHFVFCTKYRRKIFEIQGVKEKFKEVLPQVCNLYNIDLLGVDCIQDVCQMSIRCPATISPKDAISKIRRKINNILIQEISELSKTKTIWTKNFLVYTDDFQNLEVIEEFKTLQSTNTKNKKS